MEGGVDLLVVETIFDTLNAKAALFAIAELFEKTGKTVPLMISGTVTDRSGRTLSGQTVEAFLISIAHAEPLIAGLNCALGPDEMEPYIEELARISPYYMSAYPNAGLPDPLSETGFPETAGNVRAESRKWAQNGWLNIVGGCCGTTPEHIRLLADAVSDCKPRPAPSLARDPATPGSARVSRAGESVPLSRTSAADPNPQATRYSKRHLPHFDKPWAIYAITLGARRRRTLSPASRTIVLDALRHFHGNRYELFAACVMPDHVHILLQPWPRQNDSEGNPIFWTISELMHSIKSFTAHEINKADGTCGAVWEKESFDRYIRSDHDLEEKYRYILRNPWDAQVVQSNDDYPWIWIQEDEFRLEDSGKSSSRRDTATNTRDARAPQTLQFSGFEPLNITPEVGFVVIGERTNITGSPKFSKLILGDDFDGALSVARQQVQGGANILDVNMDEGMIDSEAAMTRFLNLIGSEPEIARVPLMIDSSKWSVIEAGPQMRAGKVRRELHQLEEWRGRILAPRPACQALRRRCHRDGVRRAGPGR